MRSLRTIISLLSPLLALAGCDVPFDEADQTDPTQITQGAANTQGAIAVFDILLAQPLSVVDGNDVEVNGTLRVYQRHNTPVNSNGSLNRGAILQTPIEMNVQIDLKRRGSSSLSHPKKNYSLDLKATAALLGMPGEKEWVMHSCWADKTCLRNVIGYWQAAKMFPWAPRTEFAEVFIDGDYRGLYVITEKVKLGPNRVNLPAVDVANMGGTYVFKRDGDDAGSDWTSIHDPRLKYHFVEPKQKTVDQITWLSNYMNNTVEPMFKPGSPSYNPANFQTVISQSTAANFVIMQELANNIDGYWKSMHMTKNRDGRLYMGPIWDLDLAFANANIEANDAACFTDNWRIVTAGVDQPTFRPLREMWNVRAFKQAIKDRYTALRNSAELSRGGFDDRLNSMRTRISAARARDNVKWNTLGKRTWWECTFKADFNAEVEELKRWLRARIDWMDQKIMNDPAFVP